MAANERLRSAMFTAGLSVPALAEAAGVDPKTCERWVSQGRTPHRTNAHRAAAALREDMSYLWPGLESGRRGSAIHPDLVALYPARADAPLAAWRAMFEQAHLNIGVLVYAAVFLHEMWPDFNDLLRAKAASGCSIRILLGDPARPQISQRGEEERFGHGIQSRCEQALLHYAPLTGTPGIQIRQHATTLYNSIYYGDHTMLVNTHRYGINAYATPVMHLRKASDSGLYDGYLDSFEAVWRTASPASEQ
jgi:hypothetical protein